MSPSGEARDQAHDGRSAETAADLPLALARLRWRLAASRRTAIRAVEECVRRVAALREQADDPALDALLDGFASVRAGLGALDPQRSIAPADVERLSKRLVALQAELNRYAAARGDGAAGGELLTSPAPARS
ncbi:MAG TPA: hypothetical protein VMV26_07870 [Alphaproteobacteria bacterium]|jgi:hypothetical protein|nr:hypothetical protein [Alphaproteobacteria bacterium]